MRWRDLSWSQIFTIVVGLVRWTIAIVSIAGTLALFGWIFKMFFKKDKPNELN
jgi:hypothetical protein